MTIAPQVEKKIPPFVKHWWIPILASAVLSAIAIFVGVCAEKRQGDRALAPLREARDRLDQYCSLMRVTTRAVLEDLDVPSQRAIARWTWEEIRQYDGRALVPCLIETSANQVRSCDAANPACVRAEASFAWAHFEYGYRR